MQPEKNWNEWKDKLQPEKKWNGLKDKVQSAKIPENLKQKLRSSRPGTGGEEKKASSKAGTWRQALQQERTWNRLGMGLGVAVILLGVILCLTPPAPASTSYAETASFGGDFYTYQYKATRVAAANTAATARNVAALGRKTALYAGFAFIVAGILIFLHYGKLCCCGSSAGYVPEEMPPVLEEVPPVLEEAPPVPGDILPVTPMERRQDPQLEQYRQLLEAGAITQEEFDVIKARLGGG